MTTIISLMGRKGGITKTTLTANLSAALALRGHSVLAVESDGQGSLSRLMGVKPVDGFYALIAGNATWEGLHSPGFQYNGFDWADVLQQPPLEFAGEAVTLSLLPSSDAQLALENAPNVASEIYARFDELRGHVDYILIDTSPAINEVNNAFLFISDYLLLPTLCEKPSIDMLRSKMFTYVEDVRAQAKAGGYHVPQVLGIVPNRADFRQQVTRQNIGFLQGRHGDEYHVFEPLRDLAAWSKAAQLKRSIFSFAGAGGGLVDAFKERSQAKQAINELLPIVERIESVAIEVA